MQHLSETEGGLVEVGGRQNSSQVSVQYGQLQCIIITMGFLQRKSGCFFNEYLQMYQFLASSVLCFFSFFFISALDGIDTSFINIACTISGMR